jgi:hypothetical protein
MVWLARLLIREWWRKLLARYGWAGCSILAVLMLVLVVAGAVGLGHWLRQAPPRTVASWMNRLWITWLVAGVLVGKNLTRRIRLERLKIFPASGFLRLYALGCLLTLSSCPIIFIFLGLATAIAATDNFSLTHLLVIAPAYILLVLSVHLAVSLTRSCLFQITVLPRMAKYMTAAGVCWVGISHLAAIPLPGLVASLPGYQFGVVLTGAYGWRPLLLLAGWVLLLSIPDAVTQHMVTYSGHDGISERAQAGFSCSRLLYIRGLSRTPLFGAALLGWLRNRNAVLLLVWGAAYGFCWIYFSGSGEASTFYLYGWMAMVFHSYLRANLLGVDRGAVWLYYMFPAPVERSLRVKNRTLSILQGMMVGTVMLPGLVRPMPDVSSQEWFSLACCAYSSLLLGEIIGGWFSVRDPEPIDRSTQFSGGMTTGGLVVPLCQLIFLAVFSVLTGLTRRFLYPALSWAELILIPGSLWFVSAVMLPRRMREKLLNERESIMSKLSVYSS